MALEEIFQVQAALLHDALSKAKLIAPTKGSAFDRSAGVQLRVKEGGIEIRSTDEELFFWQKVECYPHPSFLDKSFRLPTALISGFVAGLPMNQEDHQVKFLWDKDDPIWMTVKFGKTKLKARMKMIVGGAFPEWEPDDYDDLSEAQELVSRVEQIAWACGDAAPTNGTRIDGVNMISTNGTALAAIAPCVISIDEPITAIMKPLVPLIKMGTEVRVKATGFRMTIALDRETQLRTTLLKMPYPNIVDILRKRELPECFTVNRQRLIDALERLLIFVRSDNLPRCNVGVRDGYIECSLTGDRGDIQDATSVEEQTYHEDHDYKFNPNWLIQVLESFTGAKVCIHHNNESPTRYPFHVTDPANAYESWIMPMSDTV